jgi:hypothetical protein
MIALVLENLAALPPLDALVSARAARQVPEWQMREV